MGQIGRWNLQFCLFLSNILSHIGKYKVIFYYNFKLFYIIKKFVKYTKLIKFI